MRALLWASHSEIGWKPVATARGEIRKGDFYMYTFSVGAMLFWDAEAL